MLPSSSQSLIQRACTPKSRPHLGVRHKSSSPYGRTHIKKPPVLPPPVVPKFPQLVTRADGATFTHWTTSPRSALRLTRDTSVNPMWNPGLWTDDGGIEEEGETTGRLGRFNRRFEGAGAGGNWMEGFDGGAAAGAEAAAAAAAPAATQGRRKRGGK